MLTLEQKLLGSSNSIVSSQVATEIVRALAAHKVLWFNQIRKITKEDIENLLCVFPPLEFFFTSKSDQFYIVDDNFLIKVYEEERYSKRAIVVARLKEIESSLIKKRDSALEEVRFMQNIANETEERLQKLANVMPTQKQKEVS